MVGYHLPKEFAVEEEMPDSSSSGDRAAILTADRLAWRDYPGIPGAQVAAMLGDPGKAAAVIMRVRIPPNRTHPPHSHPYTEIATAISGRGGFAFGDKFDKSKGEMAGAGSFCVVPANQPHYVWTENEDVVVQVQFAGPAVIDFVDPADDPRNR
jgi:quercetin dioxygenase-like cupin family protein